MVERLAGHTDLTDDQCKELGDQIRANLNNETPNIDRLIKDLGGGEYARVHTYLHNGWPEIAARLEAANDKLATDTSTLKLRTIRDHSSRRAALASQQIQAVQTDQYVPLSDGEIDDIVIGAVEAKEFLPEDLNKPSAHDLQKIINALQLYPISNEGTEDTCTRLAEIVEPIRAKKEIEEKELSKIRNLKRMRKSGKLGKKTMELMGIPLAIVEEARAKVAAKRAEAASNIIVTETPEPEPDPDPEPEAEPRALWKKALDKIGVHFN